MAPSQLIRGESWAPAILIFGCLTSFANAQSATTETAPAADTSSAAQQKWSSPDYIHWLEERSMLKQSEELTVPRPTRRGSGVIRSPSRSLKRPSTRHPF